MNEFITPIKTARVVSVVSNNLTSVKVGAGAIYGWGLFNTTGAAKFIKLYDKASAPVVATDVPIATIPLPANGGIPVGIPVGIPFTLGIAYAITGAIGDTDATNTAANDVTGFLLYI